MKKFLCIIVVALLLSMCCFFCACSGNVKKLDIISSMSGQEYKIDLPTKRIAPGGDFLTFSCELNMQEIREKLALQFNSVEIYGSNYILMKKFYGNGKADYLVIGKLNGALQYMLLSSVLHDEVNNKYIAFPIYEINIDSDSLSVGEVYEFITNNTYEIRGEKESVLKFYVDLGLYDVHEVNENSYRISLKDAEYSYKLSDKDYLIEFDNIDEKNTVKVKVIE